MWLRKFMQVIPVVCLLLVLFVTGHEFPGVSGQGGLIWPDDLNYLGAFRLPDIPGEFNWEYSGAAMAYYPDGDLDGPDDGFPGSLFATGHDWYQLVAEISIPVPVVSPTHSLEALNTAAMLQDFQDIHGVFFDYLEIPRAGLAYLPPQGSQESGKLYFAFAAHLGETETKPSHGWSDLNLTDPQLAGPWQVGKYVNYVTGNYLFDIPQAWADDHLSGMSLATGRYRDGGQGAQGPALFAIAPWQDGNPPPGGSTLTTAPLLLYGNVYIEDSPAMDGYHHSDEWSGGAWLTAGDRAAVIFAGTKGLGEYWYGCSDGTVWEEPYPDDCPDYDRGWWSTDFEGQIIFYDPADLAAVASGEIEPWQPQSYAAMPIDEYLYHVRDQQQKHHLGGISFDRERGLLYVFEPFGDGDKPLVHVWQVN